MDTKGTLTTTMSRAALAAVTLTTTLTLAAACADTSAPAGPTTLSAWEAQLGPVVPTSPDSTVVLITGSAAAIVRQSGTEIGIGLDPFTSPVTLRWGLYNGLCDVPGSLVGDESAYAQLDEASREAASILSQQLVVGEPYHVAVRRAATDEVVACGNLSQTEL